MKNFPITDKETGREYWISRSVAVLGVVEAFDKNGNKYILAEQRGTGTPDPEYVGSWCMPCGYVDFDESCQEAISREVYEETGIEIYSTNFEFVSFNDKPSEDKRQNITFRFKTQLEGVIEDYILTDKFSETNEIMNIKWINLNEINDYKWAFNHDKIIKELIILEKNKKTLLEKIDKSDSKIIKKLIDYYPLIEKDEEWDYGFLLDLIKFKLKRMRDYFWTANIVVNEKRYGDICNTLLNILKAGYYTDIIRSSDLKSYANIKNKERFLPKYMLKHYEEQNNVWEKYGLATLREEKAKALFWKYLYNKIELLWD